MKTKIKILQEKLDIDNDVMYGILVLVPGPSGTNVDAQIKHFAGYSEEPSEIDFNKLRHELDTDESLGCVDMPYELVAAPRDIVEAHRNLLRSALL